MSERRIDNESELVEFVRAIDVPAPQRVHDRVAELVADGSGAPKRAHPALLVLPRGRLAMPLAAAAATLVLAAVAVLALGGFSGGGGSNVPDLHAASALTLAGPTSPAPGESGRDHAQLKMAVDGVAFPYWEEHFGWRATGARNDRLGGRDVRTVFYGNAKGQRIGYAIVGGTPAAAVSSGTVSWHHGTAYRLLNIGGATVVTWQRSGRLCVIAGRGVDGATLLRLASWGRGAAAVA